MDVQNNFNSMNGGNFADKHVNNVPAKDPVDPMLSKPMNQDETGIRSTGTFNSKAITQ